MDKVRLRRGTKEERRARDLAVVTDYIHGIPVREIMKRYGFRSVQTVYNAISRVNNLIEADNKEANNASKENSS